MRSKAAYWWRELRLIVVILALTPLTYHVSPSGLKALALRISAACCFLVIAQKALRHLSKLSEPEPGPRRVDPKAIVPELTEWREQLKIAAVSPRYLKVMLKRLNLPEETYQEIVQSFEGRKRIRWEELEAVMDKLEESC